MSHSFGCKIACSEARALCVSHLTGISQNPLAPCRLSHISQTHHPLIILINCLCVAWFQKARQVLGQIPAQQMHAVVLPPSLDSASQSTRRSGVGIFSEHGHVASILSTKSHRTQPSSYLSRATAYALHPLVYLRHSNFEPPAHACIMYSSCSLTNISSLHTCFSTQQNAPLPKSFIHICTMVDVLLLPPLALPKTFVFSLTHSDLFRSTTLFAQSLSRAFGAGVGTPKKEQTIHCLLSFVKHNCNLDCSVCSFKAEKTTTKSSAIIIYHTHTLRFDTQGTPSRPCSASSSC